LTVTVNFEEEISKLIKKSSLAIKPELGIFNPKM
jgi:hypothetical protein